ncbi:MAG: glycoside hydrolase family 2 [Meiothermus sp.]
MLDTLHPRPQFQRKHWRSLNGRWQFAFDDEERYNQPSEVAFDREICVPFAPESQASGIMDTRYHPVVWYRTEVRLTAADQPPPGGRLLLHFGAVDYYAKVWAGGQLVAEHTGGFTPFYADVTHAVQNRRLEIVVRAEDDPQDLAKPRGKQDWLPEPHAIWYPRTTGIWQTVWLEAVPETRIDTLRWTPYLDSWEFGLEVGIEGPLKTGLTLRVRLFDNENTLADDRYSVLRRETTRRVSIVDPGNDDFLSHTLWSPNSPHLIEATVELYEGDTVLDRIESYTAMRNVAVSGNRFLLNGRPFYLRMVLDQGYWPQSLMTPPDDDALRRDVELVKRMGFNGVRKHQKIEDPRWLYWCDRLGLLVWGEMPSAYRFTSVAVERTSREWAEAIRRDYSHPCIVAWVPLNESWGVPDLPNNAAHRNYVQALYHLTKTLDATRPVIGNDGWENLATDIISIHDYTAQPEKLIQRYGTAEAAWQVLINERPGGRSLLLGDFQPEAHALMLSEFGGVSVSSRTEGGWGYSQALSPEEFLQRYQQFMQALARSSSLAGFCYTQFTDTFQEQNGLLYADRSPKVDLLAIAQATSGKA